MTANASIRSVGDLSRHRIYIEGVYPVVDGGRFPVKRTVGEEMEVWADIFRDGHAVLAADLLWRREGAEKWFRVPMALHDNDRWRGSFTPHRTGRYVYVIEAWTDVSPVGGAISWPNVKPAWISASRSRKAAMCWRI